MKHNFSNLAKNLLEERWLSLFLLFLITIYPLFNIGLITADDYNYFLDSTPLFNSSGFGWATYNGRFYFAIMKWIYSLPYVIDSPVFFSFMHLFPIFMYMFLFVWLIDRVFADRKLTLLAGLFISLFYQITPWCSITASHPFYFTFSLSLMMVAFHLIYSYFKTNKYYYLWIGAIIFAIVTLFYESYLMFYFVIFILIVSRYKIKTLLLKENVKRLVLELMPFFLFGLLYMGAYFSFTHYYPSLYAGSQFSSELTFHDFFKCIHRLNKHALPPNTFFSYKNSVFPSQTVFITSSFKTYLPTLYEVGFVSLLKGIIAVCFYGILFSKFSTKLSYKQLLGIFLFSFVVMYVPHIPLALSVQFSTAFFSAWVPTGISYLGIILMFISIIFALNKLLSCNEIVRKTVTVILLIPLFFVTVFVHEANTGLCNDFKRAKLRMNAVDEFFNAYEIKTGEIYYLRNLHNSTSIFAGGQVPWDFWGKYLERKTGIQIQAYENYENLYNDYSDKDTTIHLVFFEQSQQGSDMILSIIKCKGTQLIPSIEDIKSDTIILGYYSNNKKFALSILSDSMCNVMVNDNFMQSQGLFHYANIEAHEHNPVSFFSITGKQLNCNTLMIKNMPFENRDFIVVAP